MLVLFATSAFAQSRSIERFRQNYEPDGTYFFYKSTLRMLARMSERLAETSMESQSESEEAQPEIVLPDIGSLIDGINKVKFFVYEPRNAGNEHFNKLQSDVEGEGFESVMTARIKGANINILMREKRSKPDGFVVLIQNQEGMSLLDLDGVPDLSNLMQLSQFMNTNAESFSLLEAFR